jgi:arylsulfatase A-like enzyme
MRTISLLSIATIIGIVGGLISPLDYIIANRYIPYEMFRTFFSIFREHLNRWVIATIIVAFLLLLLIYMLKVLWKLIYRSLMKLSEQHDKRKRFISTLAPCSIFALCSGWAVNTYWLSYTFSSMSLLVHGGIFLATLFLGWMLISVRARNVFRFLELKIFRNTALVLVVLLGLLNVGLVIDSRINLPKTPNVIILLIDTLRKDHMGVYGYTRDTTPNIDLFSEKALTFQNAVSQCSWTSPSIATLFSSLYPSVHGLVAYGKKDHEVQADFLNHEIATFPEMLKEKGYRTGAFAASRWICKRLQFDQGFDVFDPITSKHSPKPLASEVNDNAFEWILKNRNRPFFAYLHYMDVHSPYNPPAPFNSYFESKEYRQLTQKELSEISKTCKQCEGSDNLYDYVDQYDGEIRYVDDQIGHFLKKLEDENLINNTIIIITSDHGEGFFERGFRGHGWTLFNEEIDIPLIIKFPKQVSPPDIAHYKVELNDVGISILGLLNYRFPYDTDGLELFRSTESAENVSRIMFSEELSENMKSPPQIAAIKENLKAIFKLRGKRVTEIYDLEEDKSEKENILGLNPDMGREFEKEIIAWKKHKVDKRIALGLRQSTGSIDNKETLKELKSLGYL